MKPAARARILPVVILALAAAAVLKASDFWFGFASVQAQDNAITLVADDAPAAGASPPKDAQARREAPPPGLPPGEVERRILERLAQRRASLDIREAALTTREAVIAATEKRLDDRFAAFEIEREKLQSLRDENDASEAEEIKSLVSAYERMKPRDAAEIFNDLDEDILIPVAAGMRTQALAGVLAEMTPDKARILTKLLAERNQIDDALLEPRAVQRGGE